MLRVGRQSNALCTHSNTSPHTPQRPAHITLGRPLGVWKLCSSIPQVAIDCLGTDESRSRGRRLVSRRTRPGNPTCSGRPAHPAGDANARQTLKRHQTIKANNTQNPCLQTGSHDTHTHREKRTTSHMHRHAQTNRETQCWTSANLLHTLNT